MIYLLDTNIWLERLLEQERSQEVGLFLSKIDSNFLIMTDFSLHSIGVILDRLKKHNILLKFVNDVFVHGSVHLATVPPVNMNRMVEIMNKFKLDFDDAYQYVVAESYNAVIVSFDKDFDNTDCKRQTPEEIIQF